ncbi:MULTISPECIES: hypothetical protein [Paenibacillus]|uniref:hypothetical protein n=1 Tax=Paenibacillus TaxID=44249 RepID=UPI0006A71915|nr:hypothetical protein [Paenibacillus peoriae]OMF72970.1 hypothetical protein BK145_25595 [Paenibacillus peoriae]
MSMKNIKKASVVSVLSLALAIPLSASAAATDVAPAATDSTAVSQSANTSTDVNTPKAGDHVITPYATKSVVDRTLRNTELTENFDIPSGYGYVKVWIRNDGKQPIKFSVNRGSETGTQMLSGTVEPGRTYSEISSSAWPGANKYYVSLSSGKAYMEGELSVRIGTSRGEL